MNTFIKKPSFGKVSSTLLLSSLLLTACSTAPTSPSEAVEVRTKLDALQQDPEVARHARVELRDAEKAVKTAEQPADKDEAELTQHRIYMADSMVEIARAKAATRKAEADRELLGEQRDAARLASRTREADRAHADADEARRSQAEASALSSKEAEELRKQIEELEAKETERGLVLTLGDVLFASGSANIQGDSNQNLDKLVNFLKQYPERKALIEGHTDNVGSAEFNKELSRKRAEAVRSYLTGQGIANSRLTASGLGLERPVASNDTSTGKQQNRRVEVIIEN